MLQFISILLFFASILALPQGDPGDSPAARAANISILTSFFGYDGCNTTKGDQKDQVIQAQKDAARLAWWAYQNLSNDTFKTDAAAIDYFGPPDETEDTRAFVIKQIEGASRSYPSTFTDWWFDRYVKLNCAPASDSTCNDAAAYYRTKSYGDEYPTIVVCPGFFGDTRPSLRSAVYAITKNKILRGYVSALQSQATTLLHELFHVDFGAAQISNPPARDQVLYIGPQERRERVLAYKPGRAKLLALTKGAAGRASRNSEFDAKFPRRTGLIY